MIVTLLKISISCEQSLAGPVALAAGPATPGLAVVL